MTDMMFPPEEDEEVIAEAERQKAAKMKEYLINHSTVTINGVEFDTNTTGQLNMSAVGAIANWQFNLRMTQYLQQLSDPSPEMQGLIKLFIGMYKGLYKDTKVEWKGTDSKIHRVQVESILEALKKGMDAKGEVYSKEV